MPHPIPYQGSKRLLASAILRHVPAGRRRLFEPFAGSAAITLAAAAQGLAARYVLSDALEPLCDLWRAILAHPEKTADRYERLWSQQHGDPREHFRRVREAFNRHGDPVRLLYLLARCVKNAVRFNPDGAFNQAADHRRRGRRPDAMRHHITAAAALLHDRCEVRCGDFADRLTDTGPEDVVYLDPPYEGVSAGPDRRYFAQLDRPRLVAQLRRLRETGARVLLSYDGRTGERRYGVPLPDDLGLRHIELRAGRSAQATLSGRAEQTVESLYVTEG